MQKQCPCCGSLLVEKKDGSFHCPSCLNDYSLADLQGAESPTEEMAFKPHTLDGEEIYRHGGNRHRLTRSFGWDATSAG